MTESPDQIRSKRLAYSRQIHAGEIRWEDVPDRYVPEIFKMGKKKAADLTQDAFCSLKDLRAQGFSAEDIAFEFKKEVRMITTAWAYETYNQYKSRDKNTPWPNPMDL